MKPQIRHTTWYPGSYSRCFVLAASVWGRLDKLIRERGIRSRADAVFALAGLCEDPTYRARMKGIGYAISGPTKSVQWRGRKNELAGLYAAKKAGIAKSLDKVLTLAILALTGPEDLPMTYSVIGQP